MTTKTFRGMIVAIVCVSMCSVASAGLFHRRCRPQYLPCPPDKVARDGGTVEQLATSIVKAALSLHLQQNIDAQLRNSLLSQFEFQIGPAARQRQVLAALLANDDFVSRAEIQRNIFGEVRDISARLQAGN